MQLTLTEGKKNRYFLHYQIPMCVFEVLFKKLNLNAYLQHVGCIQVMFIFLGTRPVITDGVTYTKASIVFTMGTILLSILF